MAGAPPRLAEALLRRVLPLQRRAGVLGDLHEEFVARGAGAAARGWYWREAAGLAVQYLVARRAGARRGPMFDISRDVRNAWRAMVKAPATSVLIIGTLGIALGATTVGFAFADLAVIRGLPVDDPARAVFLFGVDPRTGGDRAQLGLADFADLRRESQTLTHIAAFRSFGRATLIEQGRAFILDVTRVTADFFGAMGQRAVIGRTLQPGDDQPGRDRVVVLSHRYWQEKYSGSPAALGRSLQIGRDFFEVVGVASPDMEFGNLAMVDVWMPLTVDPVVTRPGPRVSVLARLRPGVAFAAAATETAAIGERLAKGHPETNEGWRIRLTPIREATGGRNFWIVIGLFSLAVALIMAIACVNIGNLLLVRATARRREMAVRLALGAPRGRIVRQLLVEGVLLSVAGGLLAIPIAGLVLRAIRAVDSEPAIKQLWFDSHELAFIAGIVLAGPLLFSLIPALVSTRTDLRHELNAAGSRAVRAGGGGRRVLVALQLALAAILLTVSGLAWRSAVNLNTVDTGVRSASLLKFEMELDAQQYPDEAAVPSVIEAVSQAMAAIPGVRAVGVFEWMPILHTPATVTLGLPAALPAAGGARPWALVTGLRAGSLPALGVPLVAGAWPSASQWTPSTRVAIVGREAAVRYFGAPDAAVGARIDVIDEQGTSRHAGSYQIVAVSGDVITGDPEDGMPPRVWVPLDAARRVSVIIDVAGPPAEAAPLVREAAARTIPMTPLEGLEPFDVTAARQSSSDVVIITVFGGFALLALVLAATGLYGVVSYAVSRRAAEFGTRLALGARPVDVLRLVVGQSMRVLAVGLTLGLAAGLALAYLIRGAFFGVSPLDIYNTLGVALLLALVTLVASLIPARRAAKTDLVAAIRAE